MLYITDAFNIRTHISRIDLIGAMHECISLFVWYRLCRFGVKCNPCSSVCSFSLSAVDIRWKPWESSGFSSEEKPSTLFSFHCTRKLIKKKYSIKWKGLMVGCLVHQVSWSQHEFNANVFGTSNFRCPLCVAVISKSTCFLFFLSSCGFLASVLVCVFQSALSYFISRKKIIASIWAQTLIYQPSSGLWLIRFLMWESYRNFSSFWHPI